MDTVLRFLTIAHIFKRRRRTVQTEGDKQNKTKTNEGGKVNVLTFFVHYSRPQDTQGNKGVRPRYTQTPSSKKTTLTCEKKSCPVRTRERERKKKGKGPHSNSSIEFPSSAVFHSLPLFLPLSHFFLVPPIPLVCRVVLISTPNRKHTRQKEIGEKKTTKENQWAADTRK
jgi:hypothetical protein